MACAKMVNWLVINDMEISTRYLYVKILYTSVKLHSFCLVRDG